MVVEGYTEKVQEEVKLKWSYVSKATGTERNKLVCM